MGYSSPFCQKSISISPTENGGSFSSSWPNKPRLRRQSARPGLWKHKVVSLCLVEGERVKNEVSTQHRMET